MTMVDAQFTVASARGGTILRPFAGFEEVYEGQSSSIPIVLPGTLDPLAGEPGFSRYLLKGQPCPLGSKAIFWFPAVSPIISVESVDVAFSYAYFIHWRLRSAADFGQTGNGYSLAQQSNGAPDPLLNPGRPDQFIIPSATETVLYQQPEPGSPVPTSPGVGFGDLRVQAINVPNDGAQLTSATLSLPLLPPGSAPNYPVPFPPAPLPFVADVTPKGVYSQGIADLAALPQGAYSYFRPYFTIAKGNEFLISVNRVPVGLSPVFDPYQLVWNFKASPLAGLPPLDADFSNVYGTNVAGPRHKPFPNLGVYTVFGSNPS